MAYINKVTLPSGTKQNLEGTIYLIQGTQTAATNAWTGTCKLDELKNGTTIAYYLPYAGTSTAATLNLTLADGSSTTGAKSIYFTGTTVVKQQFGAGSLILMTYDGTAWHTNNYIDTNTDTKVTSAANHYAPSTASGQDKSASASGGSAAWSTDVVKGVTLNTDGKGHVTGISVTSGKMPANPVPSNNVTGSGTSGKLTKWNGTNTVTDGPSIDTSISAGSSSANLPTSAAVASFVSTQLGNLDALRFKGTIGTSGSAGTDLPTTDVAIGDTYIISTAGTYAGQTCEVGDMVIAIATTPTWTVAQTNINGAVTGPASSTANHVATFTDATGKVIKDSGFTIGKSVPSDAVFTDTNKYHKTGSWSGLTYTATAVNSADELKFTIPTGTTATTVAAGNHTHSSYVNQNAFSNIAIGETTIAADTTTDTVTFEAAEGGNITITPDATNDKVTFSTPNVGVSSSGSGNVVSAISANGHGITVTKGVTALTSHQTIKQDGVTGATASHYATCNIAAGTAAKTATITSGTFSLEAGARIIVKFDNANTAGTPTLNVYNGSTATGAKNIFYNGAKITSGENRKLLRGTCEFIYDGTQYHLVGPGANITSGGLASGWSAGSTPTLGTAIPADDITAWTTNTPTAVTLPTYTVTDEMLTISAGSVTNGVAASLSYTEKSIPNVTNVGSVPTLTVTTKNVLTTD